MYMLTNAPAIAGVATVNINVDLPLLLPLSSAQLIHGCV
jgi:hypothetical protein